jgi:hypothetical protein
VASGALFGDVRLLAELTGLLAMILGHGAMPLGLGLSPACLSLPGDSAPLRDEPGDEQQQNDRHDCDHDDCDG